MENENSNEEPLIKENQKSTNKDINKNKRISVLKQLDNNKLYPIQERVGIYIIAALSTVGLVLIGYTGVMALTLSAPLVAEAPDVDADDVLELIGEIDSEEKLGESVETEDAEFDSNDEHVDTEDDESEDEGASKKDEDESKDEGASKKDDDESDDSSTPSTATVNQDLIGFRRELVTGEVILTLNEGDIVEIIDIESNQYWAQVAYDSPDFGRVEGYIAQEFLDY